MSNKKIVEARETGKTTYLYNEAIRLMNEAQNIIVLDSATEHEDKSLIRMIEKSVTNTAIIDTTDENDVVIDKISIDEYVKNFMKFFPFDEIIKNKENVICFDLSYFLEKAYDEFELTGDKAIYNYYRNIYNQLSNQIALCIILMSKFNILENTTVFLDEIEFPVTNYDINEYQGDISFLASIHPENAFGTFYDSFEKIPFKKYVKRKDS